MKPLKPYTTDIKNWEEMTEYLAQDFMDKYFKNGSTRDSWWVCEEVGGVLFVNDYFFDLKFIVECLRKSVPVKKMFAYYDYSTNVDWKGKDTEVKMNLNHWLRSKLSK